MLGGPLERSGFPPPAGSFTPPRCGLFLLRRSQIADSNRRQLEGSEVHALADGRLGGPPAVELLTRAYFGRPDVAAGLEVARRVEFSGLGRDSLARVAGIGGQGVDISRLWSAAVQGSRFGLSGGVGGEVSALGHDDLPAAVRNSLDVILTYDWRRSGSWWRSASMLIDAIDYRSRRFWIAMGSVQDAQITPEAGEPVHSPDGGSGGWVYADLQARQRKESVLLSRQRMVNVGGVELAAWISARMMLWHDGLDQQVAALLATAPVRTVQGMFTAAHFSEAVAALNRQKVGGVPLGSSRPITLCGEARRGIMSAIPGPAHASGDQSALFDRIEYSASVDPDFVCLIHPQHAPIAVGAPGMRIDPDVEVGSYAGVMQDGEASMRGALVAQDRSDPALCVDGDSKAVGVVRLTA